MGVIFATLHAIGRAAIGIPFPTGAGFQIRITPPIELKEEELRTSRPIGVLGILPHRGGCVGWVVVCEGGDLGPMIELAHFSETVQGNGRSQNPPPVRNIDPWLMECEIEKAPELLDEGMAGVRRIKKKRNTPPGTS